MWGGTTFRALALTVKATVLVLWAAVVLAVVVKAAVVVAAVAVVRMVPVGMVADLKEIRVVVVVVVAGIR